MAESGVSVNQQCLEEFQSLKLKRSHKYILFNLNNTNTEIVVEETGKSTDYEEFLSHLPEDGCKWAVYDFEFEKPGGGIRNKIVFISWSPDNAKIKQKMLFASSRDALRRSLVGIAFELQGSEYDEVSKEVVLERASRSN